MATDRRSGSVDRGRDERPSRNRGFAVSVREQLRSLLDKLTSFASLRSRHQIPLHLAGRASATLRKNAVALTSKLPDVRNEKKLFENGRLLAQRIGIPDEVLSYLYRHSRWKAASRKEWLRDVRTACAIDLILRTEFTRNKPGDFSGLIDGLDQLRALPKGTLLLTFHGAFFRLARRLFTDLFASGLEIDRNVFDDARGGLFEALRSLQDGHHVLIAPDGPGGNTSSQIRVFDITVPAGSGAAFLAHTSGAPTAWYTVLRKGERFAVQVEPGPRREDKESYAAFEQRLSEFYGAKIEIMFSGDPQSLSLSRRWQSVFQDRIGKAGRTARETPD
jgi:hypothetical protein